MYQIRFHGRGGQGVVTAAELLASAAFYDGFEAQAFPSFGVERTGAPIEAFCRIAETPVRTREHIYAPDVIIVQDASLLGAVDVAHGCSQNTIAIINTGQDKNDIDLEIEPDNIFAIDATKIALDILGRNIVNTIILGAFAKDTEIISLSSLKKAVKQKFGEKKELLEKNLKAVELAYKL